MIKFENCDVLAVLHEIMRHNTEHFQSDFEYDKARIREAAESCRPDRKNLLWMSRPNGTHCFYEQDVYVNGATAYNSWVFYGEQTRDNIEAYAIELDWLRDGGTVTGTLFKLDYDEHYRHIKEVALPASTVRMVLNDGKEIDVKYSPNFWCKGDNIRETIYYPEDTWAWRRILEHDRFERHGMESEDWTLEELKDYFYDLYGDDFDCSPKDEAEM